MKTRIIAIALMLSAFALNAQEQAGVVKTIGRPGKPGTPIEDVPYTQCIKCENRSNIRKSYLRAGKRKDRRQKRLYVG